MLTIFTVPKAFKGPFKTIQENAINSWINLDSDIEVILFGNEFGIDKVANKYHLTHIPDLIKNKYGTPLVNYLFQAAMVKSGSDILLYINSDIILPPEFAEVLKVVQRKFKRFLAIGERIDLEVKESINFGNKRQVNLLCKRAHSLGKSHGPTGIDYFLFSKNLWNQIPPFAVGRFSWDNWLVYEGFRLSGNLIDISYVTKVIHQNHPTYINLSGSKREIFEEEKRINTELTGNKQYDRFNANYFIINLMNTPLILSMPEIGRFILNIRRNLNHLFTVRLRSYLSFVH